MPDGALPARVTDALDVLASYPIERHQFAAAVVALRAFREGATPAEFAVLASRLHAIANIHRPHLD